MTTSNSGLRYRALLWCAPALLTVHNIEEALTMPSWVPAHLSFLRERSLLPLTITFSTGQLLLSLALATLLPWLVAVWAMGKQRGAIGLQAMHLLQAIVFLNAIIPHLALLFVTQSYNPGAATALFVNIPFSLYLLQRGLKEGLLEKRIVLRLMLAACAAYPVVVAVLHFGGEFVARLPGA